MKGLAALLMVAMGMVVLAGCRLSGATVGVSQQTCERVNAVLSNGPDPDTDPQGYAQAQVIPLHQLAVSNPVLKAAVNRLADAYGNAAQETSRSSATSAAISAASKAVNAVCPGAAS
ncbi:MAG: hypothetical protein ACRDJU_09620 [Actinomycetota bacterium]